MSRDFFHNHLCCATVWTGNLEGHLVGKYDNVIQTMINVLGNGSVEEQLKCMRVVCIDTEDFGYQEISTGRLTPPFPHLKAPFEFRITLNEHDHDDFDVWALVLGHELGHIFEWTKIWGAINWEEVEMESLCDEFARVWLRTRQNRDEVITILQRLKDGGQINL